MKKILRTPFAVLLVAAMLLSLVPAYASVAYGDWMSSTEVTVNEGTTLHTETYWSTYYADRRQEMYFTYSPNASVSPIVSYAGAVTARQTGSAAAAALEAQGYRVVAGINGDFFDSNGVPTGILVSGGKLLSSDGGNYAVGFAADGSAIIGRPALQLRGSLNGDTGKYIAGFNKARSPYGGIYAYTYEFKAAHNTGTTDPGVDVILTPISEEEALTGRSGSTPDSACPVIGGTTYYRVVEVIENTGGATSVGENQLVLSVNAAAAEWELTYLRSMKPGDIFSFSVTAQDEAWNQVTEAVGALYPLVQNGQICSGLDKTNAPRTAIGIKSNGDVVFYTVDGRQKGYSVGSSQSVLAERMAELGCVTAICLDGGGSTTTMATLPNNTTAQRLNSPSDGSERSVTNHLFLVADSRSTGRADWVYLSSPNQFILAGATMEITANVVDTNYIPMGGSVELSATDGTVNGTLFTAPNSGGNVTITGTGSGVKGSLTLTVVESPDEVAIYRGTSKLESLTVASGESVDLTGKALYNHMDIFCDDASFTWSVSEGLGTIDAAGVFTASETPGSGTITLTRGRTSLSIPVTITSRPLKTLEDFEGDVSAYTGYQVSVSRSTGQNVRFGDGALQVTYDTTGSGAGLSLGLTMGTGYSRLTFWVCGDGSGNTLSLFDSNGTTTPLATLNFTGWQQISVVLPDPSATLQALLITGTNPGGTLYFDQLIASYGSVIDNTAPVISGSISGGTLTATVSDAVDGAIPQSQMTLLVDGKAAAFTVSSSGTVTASLSLSDGKAHRISLTAWDASGNVSRSGWDVAATAETASPFVDLTSASGSTHWAASYVNYLYERGVITGIEEKGAYYAKPDKQMTRAEFAVMLMRWMGLNEADYANVTLPFADADQIDSWALSAAKAMYALGIMTGNGAADGTVTFDARSTVTRAQAMTMLGRIQEKGYAYGDLSVFSDSSQVPSWALPYLQTMYAQGILAGSDGKINPNGAMTRGQACKILYMMW